MASKRRIRRKACGDKRRYATRAEAIAAMTSAKHRGITAGRVTEKLNAYGCPSCGGFHWGHKPVWA